MFEKGFKICHHCRGDGINRDYKDLYIYRRIKKIKGFVSCRYCQGSGRIDWVENAIQPEYKITGIDSIEAFNHLTYIFKNKTQPDWLGKVEPLIWDREELMEKYFKLYDLYVRDGIIIESIPGYCPDVLGFHFETFNEMIYERDQQIMDDTKNEREWNLIDKFQFQQETGMCL